MLEDIMEEKILVGNPYFLSAGYLIAGISLSSNIAVSIKMVPLK